PSQVWLESSRNRCARRCEGEGLPLSSRRTRTRAGSAGIHPAGIETLPARPDDVIHSAQSGARLPEIWSRFVFRGRRDGGGHRKPQAASSAVSRDGQEVGCGAGCLPGGGGFAARRAFCPHGGVYGGG